MTQSEPLIKKVKTEVSGGLKARALDDDDMFKSKTPAVRANAGGMPANVKKVRSNRDYETNSTFSFPADEFLTSYKDNEEYKCTLIDG